jgi:serine/threonine protein kinase
MLQVLDVALGLQYLHSMNIVHGDLKGVSYDTNV